MAGPLRFRYSPQRWTPGRVREQLLGPLEDRFGASLDRPWFSVDGYEARRLEMANGDLALFCWNDDGAYWLGNTVTPEVLWRTDKRDFAEAPDTVSRWAERELLARLETTDPWLTAYEHVAWFFLPVFFSKDGRHTTRDFFANHAAGFPDATRDEGLGFFERALSTGMLDDHREMMAAKLGTSEGLDLGRMSATMGEFIVASLLDRSGLPFEPEVELGSGHALDYRVEGEHLVEVTRPRPPAQRSAADTPVAALTETAGAKFDDQLGAHPGTSLVVDCTSFRDDEWATIAAEQPGLGYRPSAVVRARPDDRVEGYRAGSLPFDLDAVDWLDGERGRP